MQKKDGSVCESVYVCLCGESWFNLVTGQTKNINDQSGGLVFCACVCSCTHTSEVPEV